MNIETTAADDEEEKKESEIEEFVEPKLLDYVFLLDRSGSMYGKPMKLANDALELFLHSIPLGSKFNVVSFGSRYEKMFVRSQLYTEESLKRALKMMEDFDANMGGTEILDPMKDIFS